MYDRHFEGARPLILRKKKHETTNLSVQQVCLKTSFCSFCFRRATCLNGSLRGITNLELLCVNAHLFGQINVLLLLLRTKISGTLILRKVGSHIIVSTNVSE